MEKRSKPVTAEKQQQKNMNLLAAAPPSVTIENITYQENIQFLKELQEQLLKKTQLVGI